VIHINVWKIISIVGYSLAGVGLLTTIVMYFKMNIKAVYEDVTGKTTQRKLRELIEQEKAANEERIRINDYDPKNANDLNKSVRLKTGNSSELERSSNVEVKAITSEISDNALEATTLLEEVEATTLLEEVNARQSAQINASIDATTLLDSEETSPLLYNATQLLDESNEETQLLSNAEAPISNATSNVMQTTLLEEANPMVDTSQTTTLQQSSNQVDPLQTTLLDEQDLPSIKAPQQPQVDGTTVLNDEYIAGTTVLSEETCDQPLVHAFDFEMTKSRMIVYKRETIEGVF
jgi:hypothetical protein